MTNKSYLEAVAAAHQAVATAETQVKNKVAERSRLLREAIASGHTQQQIAEVLSTSQPRVAYMLRQGAK